MLKSATWQRPSPEGRQDATSGGGEASEDGLSSTALCRLSLRPVQTLRHLVTAHAAVQLPSPALDVRHVELVTTNCNELREILVVPGTIRERLEDREIL